MSRSAIKRMGVLFVFLFMCSVAGATSYSPSADTTIDQYNPSTNNGSLDSLIVRLGGSGYELDALIRFDLSSISSGSVIKSAKLKLYYFHYNDGDPVGRGLGAHRITSTWSESTVTWNTRPSYSGSATATATVPASYGWMQWDVTADVRDFVSGAKTNYGWWIKDLSSSSLPMIYFYSKEFATAGLRPVLEIEFGVPCNADTTIDQYNPTTNNGSLDSLIVRLGGSGYELDTLIKFDLSSISSGSVIKSAKLKLYYFHYNDGDPAGRGLGAHRITSTWSESTVTWNTRPAYSATASSTATVPGSYGWMQWDVTADVRDFVNGTKTNYGWWIKDLSSSSYPMIYFHSREYTDTGLKPVLEIELGRVGIIGYDDCANLPETSKCCCSINTHIHDLGATFPSGTKVKVRYRPGWSAGCTGTCSIYISQDKLSWSLAGSDSFPSGHGTYTKIISSAQNFRYVEVTNDNCYLDWSSAAIYAEATGLNQTQLICDLGANLLPLTTITVRGTPGSTQGCSGTASIYISADGSSWLYVGSKNYKSYRTASHGGWRDYKTVIFPVLAPISYRYVKVVHSNCYNDATSVEVTPIIYREYYALIVGGQTDNKPPLVRQTNPWYTWYWNLTSSMYDGLVKAYKFPTDHIYFLFEENDSGNLDKDTSNLHDDDSVKANVEEAFDHLSDRVGTADLFYLFWVSHGAWTGFCLPGTDLTHSELDTQIDKINGQKVLIFQPCHSGGAIDDVSQTNRVILTSVLADENNISSWGETIRDAMLGKADKDGMGNVTLSKVFDYTAPKIQNSLEHPLLDDDANGIGHRYDDSGYNPGVSSKDGYNAARTTIGHLIPEAQRTIGSSGQVAKLAEDEEDEQWQQNEDTRIAEPNYPTTQPPAGGMTIGQYYSVASVIRNSSYQFDANYVYVSFLQGYWGFWPESSTVYDSVISYLPGGGNTLLQTGNVFYQQGFADDANFWEMEAIGLRFGSCEVYDSNTGEGYTSGGYERWFSDYYPYIYASSLSEDYTIPIRNPLPAEANFSIEVLPDSNTQGQWTADVSPQSIILQSLQSSSVTLNVYRTIYDTQEFNVTLQATNLTDQNCFRVNVHVSVYFVDSDSDGLHDAWEMAYFGNLAQQGSDDFDVDNLNNAAEYQLRTNPLNSDTDSDGLPDYWEVSEGLNPLIVDANNDDDGDGLANVTEFNAGSKPRDVDTDTDGMPDGWEYYYGLNLLIDDSLDDLDGDGYTNLQEYIGYTDPNVRDIIGDIDRDHDVQFDDYATLAMYWMEYESSADIAPIGAGDGIVDLSDLALLVNHWLESTE